MELTPYRDPTKRTVTRASFSDAATEHIHLRCMFTTGEPYMTIYTDGPIRCSDHRILSHLYYAGGQARTAQAFVCSFPGGESTEVINVHAPSGRLTLKDPQRQKLLTNLLQSNSISSPGRTTGGTIRWNTPARVTTEHDMALATRKLGKVNFLIGGDMNTDAYLFSTLLQTCRENGSLRTETQVHERTPAKHGDLRVVAGIQATTLMTTAQNHDPDHDPYGVCWHMSQSTSSSVRPATKQCAATSSPVKPATKQAGNKTSVDSLIQQYANAHWRKPRVVVR